MATPPSALLPIFRSEGQARILAWLLLDPSREQSIASLAQVAGVAQPNTLREVNRLVNSGLLAERRAGNSRLVRADTTSPYFEPLVAILTHAYGPASVIPAVLGALHGVELVVLVGSWAERFLGTPGAPPGDVDVVVVGSADRRALRAANRELEEQLRQPVQITLVSPEEWQGADSAFIQTVQARPYVLVVNHQTEVDA